MAGASISAAVRTLSMRLVLPSPSSFLFGSARTLGGAKKLRPTWSLNVARAQMFLAFGVRKEVRDGLRGVAQPGGTRPAIDDESWYGNRRPAFPGQRLAGHAVAERLAVVGDGVSHGLHRRPHRCVAHLRHHLRGHAD